MNYYLALSKEENCWTVKLTERTMMSDLLVIAKYYRREGFGVKLYLPAWEWANGR